MIGIGGRSGHERLSMDACQFVTMRFVVTAD